MRINEDYYDNIDASDITSDVDVMDDILLAIDHVMDGTYDPDLDVNLNELNVPVYKPQGKLRGLIPLIKMSMKVFGNNANLNWIDTSECTTFISLFKNTKVNGDISKWDTSNITNMKSMFENCSFNGDISSWNTRKVTNMQNMFYQSDFSGDLSGWDVSNVENMQGMFYCAKNFDCNLSRWNVRKVRNMSGMFAAS